MQRQDSFRTASTLQLRRLARLSAGNPYTFHEQQSHGRSTSPATSLYNRIRGLFEKDSESDCRNSVDDASQSDGIYGGSVKRTGICSLDGGRELNFGPLLRYYKPTVTKKYSGYTETVENITAGIGKQWILRDAFPYKNSSEREATINLLVSPVQRRTNGIRIIADHPSSKEEEGGHIHFIHDCTYHHGQCRCSFSPRLARVRHPEYRVRSSQFSTDDIRDELFHFHQEGKYLLRIILGNTARTLPDPGEVLSYGGRRESQQLGEIQESLCHNEHTLWEQQQYSSNYQRCSFSNARRVAKPGSSSSEIREELSEKILKFLLNYTVVPVEGVVKSSWWLNSDFKFIHSNNKHFVDALEVFNCLVVKKTISELEHFWCSKDIFYWDTREYKIVNKDYMSIEDSVKITLSFLRFQFKEDEFVIDFLEKLSKVINRETKKRNAIEVVSPPTSGKSWFFDSICTFCISWGQIQNHNRHSRFALENAIGKRINIFNEPNFDQAFHGPLLMILAGDPLKAEAKYKPHAELNRAPVIITSNVSKFPNEQRWNDRMYRFQWQRAPMLKNVKDCHPLTFVHLLKYFKIKHS